MIYHQKQKDEKLNQVLVPESYRYLLNSISKKTYINKNYTEPILLCENLKKIKKFLKNILIIKKSKVIKFFHFFCFFVFLFLLKNNHFLEARFFAFNFCSKIFGDSTRYSFFKVNIWKHWSQTLCGSLLLLRVICVIFFKFENK